jgi:hypothetical protein
MSIQAQVVLSIGFQFGNNMKTTKSRFSVLIISLLCALMWEMASACTVQMPKDAPVNAQISEQYTGGCENGLASGVGKFGIRYGKDSEFTRTYEGTFSRGMLQGKIRVETTSRRGTSRGEIDYIENEMDGQVRITLPDGRVSNYSVVRGKINTGVLQLTSDGVAIAAGYENGKQVMTCRADKPQPGCSPADRQKLLGVVEQPVTATAGDGPRKAQAGGKGDPNAFSWDTFLEATGNKAKVAPEIPLSAVKVVGTPPAPIEMVLKACKALVNSTGPGRPGIGAIYQVDVLPSVDAASVWGALAPKGTATPLKLHAKYRDGENLYTKAYLTKDPFGDIDCKPAP